MASIGLSTRNVALFTVFVALSVIIIKVIPGIPVIGVDGSQIKFDAAVAPVYGMVIGPYLGFLAALLGGLLTSGSPFSFLTSFAPAVSAMVAGFMVSNKVTERLKISGWIAAATILGLLIVGWYLTWVGIQAPLYPILHFGGFFAILITRRWTAERFNTRARINEISVEREGWQFRTSYILTGVVLIACAFLLSKPYVYEGISILQSTMLSIPLYSLLSILLYMVAAIFALYGIFGSGKFSFISAIFTASYCGIIADHMTGNLAFIGIIDILVSPESKPLIPQLFMSLISISAVERLLMTTIATLFGVSLLTTLFRAGFLSRKQDTS